MSNYGKVIVIHQFMRLLSWVLRFHFKVW